MNGMSEVSRIIKNKRAKKTDRSYEEQHDYKDKQKKRGLILILIMLVEKYIYTMFEHIK